jgi:hypothetical protein
LETLRIEFSRHTLGVDGHGLRELLCGLQNFEVKWMRPTPERYRPLGALESGHITQIRVTAEE